MIVSLLSGLPSPFATLLYPQGHCSFAPLPISSRFLVTNRSCSNGPLNLPDDRDFSVDPTDT